MTALQKLGRPHIGFMLPSAFSIGGVAENYQNPWTAVAIFEEIELGGRQYHTSCATLMYLTPALSYGRQTACNCCN